jgi:hypothetical protein
LGGGEILPARAATPPPAAVFYSVRLSRTEAPNAAHAAVRAYAALEQARFRTEAALCPDQAVHLGEVIEEIGPVPSEDGNRPVWLYRRAWDTGDYACGGHPLDEYLRRLSRYLPPGATLHSG